MGSIHLEPKTGFSFENMSGWLKGLWIEEYRISSHRFFSSMFKRLTIHTVKHVSKSLSVKPEVSRKFIKVTESNQAVFHESRAGIIYFSSRSGGQRSWGRSCEHRCLKLPALPGRLLSSFLLSCIPRAKRDCLNWPPALLTVHGSPSVPLLCRCQKDLRLFSLAEKRAPFGFQAVPLELFLSISARWAGN